MNSTDEMFMHMALNEAEKGAYTTTPNPRVGCVMVRNNQVLSTGFHAKAGHAHAEVNAIENARSKKIALSGATAYVTLEPCSHHGRTGPCAEALIRCGVTRVVVAIKDPNPLVSGRGIALLESAGIEVTTGVLEERARWINRGFLSRMERGRPWVRLKVASSADGITALPNGVSQWITGPQARQDGHRLRAQACAVLSGIGTIKADNPRLNVRDIETTRQPIKVVVDSKLEISPAALLLQEGTTWIAHTQDLPPAWLDQHPNKANIHCVQVRADQADNGDGKTDLAKLLKHLADHCQVNELHLEAGFGLNGSFLQTGLVDEIVQYIAPRFLGSGAGLFRLPEQTELPDALDWSLHTIEHVGTDAKLVWIKQIRK
ncbi:MAG TPA: bifunctional diaminohydroxyphosphoribosylaminopyrimidine deaminase/5-amino-6-(5-phosphoribosylamino)uracil reductase RibD [Limnobacter sp.]|uniref:bifunctional diaminohydroxyphosphoribosylaminopyrimidine deaminase/5-amino-6-(5-phosphoribosylamino)uracil reductase RibD n=1 Tax=Limnobacter sp. TaxID=2003368 RepID=UPI002E363893|nr:bifunctional diaminohydroxyphosphoribosylaminopyrimidine deaminase/5-amino-6-(5-phosphoribosylamino)uracil reductase RibD [Limnobacter sp.]HEX5486174.1 bifunctional diaminohydroxyphosphoribosylaminopyrimidine deaminase/5-amino-6-(5-phosphoribosylamino)uracil reductase RibD [Limnobacter sp.]